MIWLVKRITRSILAIFFAITISFFLVRLMPGNPITSLLFQYIEQYRMPPEKATEMISALFAVNLNEPLWIQYIKYISNVFSGNLGISLATYGTPVIELIAYALPWTVFIVSTSLILSFAIGVVSGMIIAYKRGGILDNVLSLYSSVTASIPSYIIGVLLLIFLSIQLGIFPRGGCYNPQYDPATKGLTLEFISSVFYYATLPIISYLIVSVGSWTLTMKGSTISVLGEDYVMAAEARGLKKRRIVLKYVGRTAILPLYTSLLISIGGMFGGSIFIETIFSYRGMGYLLSRSLQYFDYPVIQGCLNIIIVAVIIANLIADISYGLLDPRIRVR